MGIRLQLSNAQGVGDNALAGNFKRLWITLGEAASLWTRKEPLCARTRNRTFRCSVQGVRDLVRRALPRARAIKEMKHLVQKQRLARLARDEEVHAQTEYV
jgi:hypothetical protein